MKSHLMNIFFSVLATVPEEKIEETIRILTEKQERIAENSARMKLKKHASSTEKRAYALTKRKSLGLSDFQCV